MITQFYILHTAFYFLRKFMKTWDHKQSWKITFLWSCNEKWYRNTFIHSIHYFFVNNMKIFCYNVFNLLVYVYYLFQLQGIYDVVHAFHVLLDYELYWSFGTNDSSRSFCFLLLGLGQIQRHAKYARHCQLLEMFQVSIFLHNTNISCWKLCVNWSGILKVKSLLWAFWLTDKKTTCKKY